ncbi:MAG: RNA polymerase sigma factor [Acidobacteriota bacterium]
MPDPFSTTSWSMVLQAQEATGRASEEALGTLCETYWFPLYAYVRRRGLSHEDAADTVQGFFIQLIEARYVDAVTPEAGRFRAFLLHKMKHYLANEREHARAWKRGGRASLLSLDVEDAERRYGSAVSDRHTPEKEFDRRWAMTVVDRVIARMGQEAERRRKADEFRLLRGCLVEGRLQHSYREVAARLSTSESAVKSSVRRLRQRFGRLIRDEVAQTLEDASEVDAEVRFLFASLA